MENLTLYIALALGLINLTLIIIVIILYKRISKLTDGKKGLSLESHILENNELIKQCIVKQEKDGQSIVHLKSKILEGIQNIDVVRFNPFKEMGGNQSFAIALTNEHKNGVIISSLYNRQGVNVFAKPILNGISEFKLSKEEQQALDNAHK